MEFPVLSRDAIRKVDRIAIEKYGISGLVLMENAGRGVADIISAEGIRGPVAVCCGKGNNAGDGFVIARHLELGGHSVSVLLWSDPAEFRGDARTNFEILRHTDVPIVRVTENPGEAERLVQSADWIVDALLGTGVRGEPRPPLDAAIRLINESGGKKFAVDVPSGLDCDTGEAASICARADMTGTFVAAKPGFFQNDGPAMVGRIYVLQIGTPRKIVQEVSTS